MKNHEMTLGWLAIWVVGFALAIVAAMVMNARSADVEGYVTPGTQYTMGWTPADPAGDAYLVERSLNGGGWTPMLSVITNEYVDSLPTHGDAAQYRVHAYKDVITGWTDLDGYHTKTDRIVGPVSDVSNAVVAKGVEPEAPGACGVPFLKR